MLRRAVLLGAAVWGLAACDQHKIAKLEEGVATEADVRREFGNPAAVFDEPGGARTLEYPRQPEGQTNYFITIGGDGKMSSLRQVLKDDSFVRIKPGLDKAEVRRLLGRPAKSQTFAGKGEEVWDWRYLAGQQPRIFSVTFDINGRVLSAASADEARVGEGTR